MDVNGKTESAMSRFRKSVWKKLKNSCVFSCFRRAKRSTEEQMTDQKAAKARKIRSVDVATSSRGVRTCAGDDKSDKGRKTKRVTFKLDNDDDRARDREFRVRCYRCDGIGHKNVNCSRPIVCYNCGENGHVSRYCPYKRVERRLSGYDTGTWRNICYYCNKSGHLSRNCMEKRYDSRNIWAVRNNYNSYGRTTARDCPHPAAVVNNNDEVKKVIKAVESLKKLPRVDNAENVRVPATETAADASPTDTVNAENLKKNKSESPAKCDDSKDSKIGDTGSADVATGDRGVETCGGEDNGGKDRNTKHVTTKVDNDDDRARDSPELIVRCHRCDGVGHTKRNCFGAMVCFNCRETGHAIRNCPQKTVESRPSIKCTGKCSNTCFYCKKTGHFSRNYAGNRNGVKYSSAFSNNWNNSGRTTVGYCGNCGVRGHWSRECRKLK